MFPKVSVGNQYILRRLVFSRTLEKTWRIGGGESVVSAQFFVLKHGAPDWGK